jgi:hypothetical protein
MLVQAAFATTAKPEEAFRAIARLRKEARDEIERLLGFLDGRSRE